MNLGPIYKAMITRLKADSTLWDTAGSGSWKALIAGGFHAISAPSDTPTFPYGTINLEAANDAAFTMEGMQFVATITVHDKAESGLNSLDPIMARLFGDAIKSPGASDRAPSYGFHRHALTIAVDGTLNPLTITGDEHMQWVSGFDSQTSPTVIANTSVFKGSVSIQPT